MKRTVVSTQKSSPQSIALERERAAGCRPYGNFLRLFGGNFTAVAVRAMFVIAAFAAAAFSQDDVPPLDTALVPMVVNVDAVVTVTPPVASEGAEETRSRVLAGSPNMLTLIGAGFKSSQNTAISQRQMTRQQAPAALSYARGRMQLRLNPQSFQNADISLFSINGKRVVRDKAPATATAGGFNITRQNLAAGVYILSVKGANRNSYATKLTHRGGRFNMNVTFGRDAIDPSSLKKSAVTASDSTWKITVQATGHADTTFYIVPTKGANETQNITLRSNIVMNMRGDSIFTIDGANRVYVLDSITVVNRLTYMDDSSLVFVRLFSGEQYIKAGDIITAGSTPNALYGLFHRVKSISTAGVVTTISTEAAFLEDVFSELSIHETRDLQDAEAEYYDEEGNVVDKGLQKKAAGGPALRHDVSLNAGFTLENPQKEEQKIEVTFSGTTSLEKRLFLDFRINRGQLNFFEFSVIRTESVDLSVQISGEVEFLEKKHEIVDVKTPPITVMAGPVPIVFAPGLEVGAKLTAKGRIDFETKLIEYTQTSKSGVQYTAADGWKTISESTPVEKSEEPESTLRISGEVTAGLYFEPYIELYGGLSKVFVGAEIYRKYEVKGEISAPEINAKAVIEHSIGAAIGVGVELKILFFTAKYEKSETLFELSTGEIPIFPNIGKLIAAITDTTATIVPTFEGECADKPTDVATSLSDSPDPVPEPDPGVEPDPENVTTRVALTELENGGFEGITVTNLKEDSDYYTRVYFTNFWGSFHTQPTKFRTVNKSLRDALERFYYSTGGPNWTNNTNWLSARPLNEWYGLDSSARGIRITVFGNNLTGNADVTDFKQLVYLRINWNELTGLDVRGSVNLDTLWSNNNQIAGSVDLSGLSKLTFLSIDNNLITNLNISGTSSLTWAQISLPLTTLNATNTGLYDLRASATFVDVRGSNNLDTLIVGGSTLNAQGLPNLRYANIGSSVVNLSGCTKLNTLNINSAQLTHLDVSGCTNLTNLSIPLSGFTEFDASGLSNLQSLVIGGNALTKLNVSGLSKLRYLSIGGYGDYRYTTALTELDISGLTALDTVYFYNSTVYNFNASGCTSLRYLRFKERAGMHPDGVEFEPYVKDLNLSNSNVSGVVSLTGVVSGAQGRNIDVSGTSITELNVESVHSLNFSGCTDLKKMIILYSYLESLDARGLNNLEYLGISNDTHRLRLNLSGLTNLQVLSTGYSRITHLDVSGCIRLEDWRSASKPYTPGSVIHDRNLEWINVTGAHPNVTNYVCSYTPVGHWYEAIGGTMNCSWSCDEDPNQSHCTN